MPWVEFVADHDWYPRKGDRRAHTAFKVGHLINVPRACATAVKAAGAAVGVRAPKADQAAAIKANGNRRPT